MTAVDKLVNWMRKNQLGNRQVAERLTEHLGFSIYPHFVWRWCANKVTPSKAYRAALKEITDGTVTIEDWSKSEKQNT